MSSARKDFLAGFQAVAPVVLSMVPFGLISGLAAVNVGFSELQTIVMSFVVYAGAAQLAAIELLRKDAPLIIVILAALVVNVRYVMYSASIAPFFQPFTTLWKGVLGYLLSDPAYAVSVLEFSDRLKDSRRRWWYYFGAAFPLWVIWQISTILGVFLGVNVPVGLSLDFAVPLMFISLLFPAMKDAASRLAALVAGLSAVFAAGFPFQIGLIVGALSGILVGVCLERLVVND